MAINGRVKVAFGEVFPQGLFVWSHVQPQPARDFDKSTPDRLVQATDRETGLPVWTVDALDADEVARGRQQAVTIRIVAPSCPVLPQATAGPVRPVELENLSIAAYVEQPANGRPRVAWSYRATGIRAPGMAGKVDGEATPASSTSPAATGSSGTSSAASSRKSAA